LPDLLEQVLSIRSSLVQATVWFHPLA